MTTEEKLQVSQIMEFLRTQECLRKELRKTDEKWRNAIHDDIHEIRADLKTLKECVDTMPDRRMLDIESCREGREEKTADAVNYVMEHTTVSRFLSTVLGKLAVVFTILGAISGIVFALLKVLG